MADRYTVSYAPAATADLLEIADYVAERQGIDAGDDFLDDMIERIATLERYPLRGVVPKELGDNGDSGFRQIVAGKLRIVYAVLGDRVVVLLIANGRRDMQALLRDRLLGPSTSA